MAHPFHLQVITAEGSHSIRHDGGAATLSDVLRRAELPLNTRCGGKGICDGCLVELVSGSLVSQSTGQIVHADVPAKTLRSCQYRLQSPQAVVRVPQRSMLKYHPVIETDYRINVSWSQAPLYRPLPGQPPGLGAAIDVGTTTVVVMVVDLKDGRVLGRAADFNRQMSLGDDVIARINLCMTDPPMLGQLQEAVAGQTILPLLRQALAQAGADLANVKCLSICGNTTMLHLLAGVDPSPLGVAPFTPAFVSHKVLPAAKIFRDWPSAAACHLLPGATAYIGADITAGIVASGLIYDDGPSLLVDVGTNGEIVLRLGGRMMACATAAGPAFEGAGLSSGLRAGIGAISHVSIGLNPFHLKTECIGAQVGNGARPLGICGSAYVDFLATARRAGLLNEFGRFARHGLPTEALQRIIPWHGNDLAFRLEGDAARQPIVISQRDIAHLLQAKAAIAAGVLTLLNRAAIAAADVKTVYLAGGFGTNLGRDNAIACGLLPGFKPEQIQPVGNAALAGAYLSLMDAGLLAELARAGRELQVIELNLDPGFESCYIDQLMLR